MAFLHIASKSLAPAFALFACLVLSPAAIEASTVDGVSTWLVDTHGLSTTRPTTVPFDSWNVQERDEQGEWSESSPEQLAEACGDGLPTLIFCHGNLTGRTGAIRDADDIARKIRCRTDAPFRLVVWAWPAEKQLRGPLRDTRLKACRSEAEAVYLARLLQHVRPTGRITLLGYSFGARISAGSLHLLSGGRLAGRELSEASESDSPNAPSYRMVLIAAAIDRASLVEGHRLGRAMDLTDSCLVTINERDPALKYYPMLVGPGGPKAAGRFGPMIDPARRDHIRSLNVTGAVGKSHDLERYLRSASLDRLLPDFMEKVVEATPLKKTAPTLAMPETPEPTSLGTVGPTLAPAE